MAPRHNSDAQRFVVDTYNPHPANVGRTADAVARAR
jgi:hypothetical protein